ncbi:MAG: sulfatase-like hydrolase/transferase [Rhodobacterales bacterium]|nr:sulfatase-like hydrolase/transferase [Rhodobacterales bacterium]
MSWIRTWGLFSLLACNGSGTGQVGSTVPTTVASVRPAPNVLILFLDDVGVDKVGVYDLHPHPAVTPNIDAFAATGVRFRNAYAAPSCSPSRASLLTGRYGRRTGLGGVIAPIDDYSLPHGEVTLPELLRDAPEPYRTVALGKWHLAPQQLSTYLDEPNLHGFDHFSGTMGNLVASSGVVTAPDYFEWEKVVNGDQFATTVYATTDTTNDAIDQLQTMPEPWFMYVAFAAPHTPTHFPPPELIHTLPTDEEWELLPFLYDLMLQSVDTEIGRLLASMTPELRQRTVIILLADNGTPVGRARAPWASEQAKLSPYEGGSKVPFMVSGPGIVAGGVADAMVHVVDLLPTLTELAHINPDAIVRDGVPVILDGQSLLPYLTDPTLPGARQTLYTERFFESGPGPYNTDHRGLRNDTHKLIRVGPGEAFYALDDPFEYEGPPIAEADRTADEQAIYQALSIELDERLADMAYEGD